MSELTDKLTNEKVSDLDGGRFYLVDKAKTASLHADIIADKYVIPSGWLLVLKDGANFTTKMGDGISKWSTSPSLGNAPSTAQVSSALKAKTQIAALVSPTADYASLTTATAAIKSIIDALKA